MSAHDGRGLPKEMRALVRKARKAGVVMEFTGANHVRLVCPNGALVYTAMTPSNGDWEARRVRRDLAKLGGITL